MNTSKPCENLITAANARKQIAEARAILAEHPKLFGNMNITTTLDNGGKLVQGKYRGMYGFYLNGDETIGEFRRELRIQQTDRGFDLRYVVSMGRKVILWGGLAEAPNVSSFGDALKQIL